MKAPWIGSLFVFSGLIAGSAWAQQEVAGPTSSSPYGVGAGDEVGGSEARTEGAPAAAPADPVANAFGPGVADRDCRPSASDCDCRGRHGDPSPYYGSVEFLWLRWKRQNVPPLVTFGDPNDTPSGALGQPGTVVLFGGEDIGQRSFGGGRFTVGRWLGDDHSWGVETSFLFVEQRKSFFSAQSSGAPGTGVLAVPFFNNDGGFEDANQVALDSVSSGGIAVRLTQRAWGAELNLRRSCQSCNGCLRLTGLAGFRFFDLDESLDLETNAVALPTDVGIQSSVAESHACRNHFYGGQIGAQADYCRGDWRLSLLGKVALGDNNEHLNISGTTVNVDPINGTVVAPGGIFTGPNNMGNHERDRFAVLPEVGVTVGRRLGENLTVSVGYTFLYISRVIRPGDQIDRVVNFQSNDRPTVLFNQTDFWMQGVSFGLQYRF